MKTTFEKLCEHIKTTKARQPLDPFALESIKWLCGRLDEMRADMRGTPALCLSCVHCSVRDHANLGPATAFCRASRERFCDIARQDGKDCGPDAALYQKRPS